MHKEQLSLFSDVDFIQSLDKPKILSPLLLKYKEHFAKHGMNVEELSDDDNCKNELVSLLCREKIPTDLEETLMNLIGLSSETGHDLILQEANRRKVAFNIGNDNCTAPEFAISVYQEHPEIIEFCQKQLPSRNTKNYQEFRSKNNNDLSLETAKQKQSELAEYLADWFESKHRSRACDIYVHEERGKIGFEIFHGRLLRTDAIIGHDLRSGRTTYRPQKQDSVVFDTQTCVLKVNAGSFGEKELYRKGFGKVFFNDESHFVHGEFYTLAPLQMGRTGIRLVRGIESVRLSEVTIAIGDEEGFTQTFKAHCLFDSIDRYNAPDLSQGRLLRASFIIKYTTGGQARKLELRPPNIASYDRTRDGDITELFLRDNGMITGDTR